MGAEPYWYIVPYESDIDAALQKLRQREFRAGRYNPVTPFPKFPVDLDAEPAPAQHGSIEEVMEVADEDGTRSILDIQHAAAAPFDGTQMQFFTAFPLVEADLVESGELVVVTCDQREVLDNSGLIGQDPNVRRSPVTGDSLIPPTCLPAQHHNRIAKHPLRPARHRCLAGR